MVGIGAARARPKQHMIMPSVWKAVAALVVVHGVSCPAPPS